MIDIVKSVDFVLPFVGTKILYALFNSLLYYTDTIYCGPQVNVQPHSPCRRVVLYYKSKHS